MRSRSRLPIFLVALLSFFVAVPLVSGPTSHAGATFSVGAHTFNLAGGAGRPGFNPSSATLAKYLVAVASPQPWTLATQETCSDVHFWTIAVELAQFGYHANFYTGVWTQPTCGFYGNAVFALGGDRGSAFPETITKTFDAQRDAPCTFGGGIEQCRGFVCRRLNSYLGPYAACSAHMSNGDAGIASLQALEYHNTTVLSYLANGRIAGGDFNLRPADTTTWTLSPYYWEVDPLQRFTSPSNGPTAKIDYAFGGNFGANRLTPAPYCNFSYSDHCHLSGYFVI